MISCGLDWIGLDALLQLDVSFIPTNFMVALLLLSLSTLCSIPNILHHHHVYLDSRQVPRLTLVSQPLWEWVGNPDYVYPT